MKNNKEKKLLELIEEYKKGRKFLIKRIGEQDKTIERLKSLLDEAIKCLKNLK